MQKHIANMVTISRMIFSVLLFCYLKNPIIFIIIYCICGISDVLDGFIARKTNTKSALGAKLDSIADFLMFGIITISLMILAGVELKRFLPTILMTALVRFLNVIFAANKYHSFVMIHTWGNKITGLVIFIAPVLWILTHNMVILLLVCILSLLSALEESMILITSDTPDLNRRSIFLK